MRLLLVIVALFILSAFHVFALEKASEQRKALPQDEGSAYVIPAPILKITALEFDGLASDFLFLQALVFEGSTFERKEKPRVKEWEYRWMYNILSASTDLDPYFFDPYYFGNANLTWEGNLIKETNTLLDKGSRYRDWDWMLPFYIGFNNFYFLQDNEKAAFYLMEAAKRPTYSGTLLPTLAARLAYQGKRTENAIIFLQEILSKTEDKNIRWIYERRLNALKAILFLEKAVAAYQDKFKAQPNKLDELIAKGILSELPQDPYGGKFYLDKDGSIKTTSELR
jgi:hypothetical protein